MFEKAAGFDLTVAEGAPSPESVAMLLAVDPKGLSRGDAVAAAVGVQRARRMLEGVEARLLARAAGEKPASKLVDEAAQEISAALGMHPQTAAHRVDTSRSVVRRLPVTLKALEAGSLSWRQVELVERTTRELPVLDAQAVEAAAVPGSPMRLRQRLMREVAKLAPELLRKKAEKARNERGADYWNDVEAGSAGIGLSGPIDLIAQMKAAIDAEARARVAGECRTISQRQFDVVLGWSRARLGLRPVDHDPNGQIIRPTPNPPAAPGAPGAPSPAPAPAAAAGSGGRCGSCGRSGPARVPIAVTLSLETLLRLSEAPGELEGYGPIPAEVARTFAADGDWRRWLVDEAGRLSEVGSRVYRPSAALDRFVRGRDRTCRFPSCTRPAVDCDLDHTQAFHTEGGPTHAANLVALCRTHHRLKHETDWTYRLEPDGTVVWTAPSGRTYAQDPEYLGDDPVISTYLTESSRKERERREKKHRKEQQKQEAGQRVPDSYDEPPPF